MSIPLQIANHMHQMSANLVIQYTIVGIVVLGALVWIVVKVFRNNRNGVSCPGCSMSGLCTDKKRGHRADACRTTDIRHPGADNGRCPRCGHDKDGDA